MFGAKYIAEGYTSRLDSIALRPFKAQGSLAFREQSRLSNDEESESPEQNARASSEVSLLLRAALAWLLVTPSNAELARSLKQYDANFW